MAKRRNNRARTPTRFEHTERVDNCVLMLSRGFRKGEIKRRMFDLYGLSPRSVERYLARARAVILDKLNKSREQMIAESVAVYDSVLQADAVTPTEITKANAQKDKLLGLNAPERHVVDKKVTIEEALSVWVENRKLGTNGNGTNGNGAKVLEHDG